MKKNLIYILSFVVLFFSCKKQNLPEPEITDPHFYVKCEMNGEILDIEAGNDDYYMNSSWYHEEAKNLFIYKADLGKQVGSGYKITILINDFKSAPLTANMSPDSALRIGAHLYDDQNRAGLERTINFEPLRQNNLSSTYTWAVTDGTIVSNYGVAGVDDKYSISTTLDADKTYSVTFKYGDGLGTCDETLTKVFKAGSELQTSISALKEVNATDAKYTFSCTEPYSGNFDYSWTFSDGSTDDTKNPTKVFGVGLSVVKLKLTDKTTGEYCNSIYQLNTNASCDANFNAVFLPIKNDRVYASVTVLLTDPNGLVYSSRNLVQPQESDFAIVSVGNYKNNERNEPTKILDVKFNCVVKNGNNEILLKHGLAKIAVAYK